MAFEKGPESQKARSEDIEVGDRSGLPAIRDITPGGLPVTAFAPAITTEILVVHLDKVIAAPYGLMDTKVSFAQSSPGLSSKRLGRLRSALLEIAAADYAAAGQLDKWATGDTPAAAEAGVDECLT
jgi:hypothetical protein